MAKKKEPVKLKCGEFASWASTAQGTTMEKVGEVVYVLPPGLGFEHAEATLKAQGVKFISTWGGGVPRDHESYALLVKNGSRTPLLYWPRTAALTKVKKTAAKAGRRYL